MCNRISVIRGIVYILCLDDMIISGKIDEEYFVNFDVVLECLEKFGLWVNFNKCDFF